MLERNRPQPPRPSAPSQTAGGFDGPSAACGGLFASPEDYDATGILAGVDPYESRYWWMPELYTSPTAAGDFTLAVIAAAQALETPVPETPVLGTPLLEKQALESDEPTGDTHRTGLLERLMRAGQAARRVGSRSTAAA